jgi:DNA-binding protein H-NS
MLFSLGGGSGVNVMNSDVLQSMSTDELWSLHEQVVSTLARKILEEKAKLEERLRRLENRASAVAPTVSTVSSKRTRRPYPKVLPKYQNPRNPAERWSGRGKQPHWVRAQLKAGKKLEHLRIA